MTMEDKEVKNCASICSICLGLATELLTEELVGLHLEHSFSSESTLARFVCFVNFIFNFNRSREISRCHK